MRVKERTKLFSSFYLINIETGAVEGGGSQPHPHLFMSLVRGGISSQTKKDLEGEDGETIYYENMLSEYIRVTVMKTGVFVMGKREGMEGVKEFLRGRPELWGMRITVDDIDNKSVHEGLVGTFIKKKVAA